MCDSSSQCPDGSDEGGLCKASDECKSFKCSHDCVQMPSGPVCLCPKGFHLVNNKTCEDVNECKIYGMYFQSKNYLLDECISSLCNFIINK